MFFHLLNVLTPFTQYNIFHFIFYCDNMVINVPSFTQHYFCKEGFM